MPTWSIARQGKPPTALPAPARDYDRTLVKLGGEHQTLDATTVSDVVGRKRQFKLSWGKLSDANFRLIEQYHDGSMGLGPFEYREPNQPMKLVNIVSLSENTPVYVDYHVADMVLKEV